MRVEAHWLLYHSHPVHGHAFLRGSITPESLEPETADLLADFTDRTPGYGDGRLSWSPYPSGCPVGMYYVVASTRPDPRAARPGSIVTQAILFPIEVLAESPDILSAIGAATGPLPDSGPLPVDFREAAPPLKGAGMAVISAFVRANGKPVAVIGEGVWEDAVAETWGVLWPEARRRLYFRAFEAPSHLVNDPE